MYLRKLLLSDAERMLEWMNDLEISSNFRWGDNKQISLDHAFSFIQMASVDGLDVHRAVSTDTDQYMGTISLKNIDIKNYNAEYAIGLHPDAIGKGYASWATYEILHFAFIELDLHKVYLNVISTNERAIRFYRKFGFIYEGTFVAHAFLHQNYVDLQWYRILKHEYLQLLQV